MWRAFLKDVVSMIAAIIVLTALASVLWLTLILAILPRTELTAKVAWAPMFAPTIVGLSSMAALVYGLLRSRRRPEEPIGRPYWLDTVVFPALAGGVLAMGWFLVTLLGGYKGDAVDALAGGLGQAVALGLAAWVVVLVRRVFSRPVRALAIAAVVVVVVFMGTRLSLDAWGERLYAKYKRDATAEITAERARIAADRLPVLFGTPLDANAAERYRKAAKAIDIGSRDRDLIFAARKAGPLQPPSSEAVRVLEQHRPELQALRKGVRCIRCDWGVEWEKGFDGAMPSSLAGARMAGNLLTVEGYRQAWMGNVAGAVERDLEVIRMGRDFETSGAVVGVLGAIAIESDGTSSLLRLLASGHLPLPSDWDTIEAKLDLLEPRLASASVGYRGERLCYVGWESFLKDGAETHRWLSANDVFDFGAPGRFILGDAVRSMNEALRQLERAYELPDPRETARMARVITDRVLSSPNPIARISLPSLTRAGSSAQTVLAQVRLLRAVCRLERMWTTNKKYPASAEGVDLPIDPFAYPARLHYASLASGRGYRVWSLGENGTDEGGAAKGRADEVFERSPRETAP